MFLFGMLARVGASPLTEILPLLPLLAFDYVSFAGVYVHLLTILGCALQVAIFLKAAQWFFYP